MKKVTFQLAVLLPLLALAACTKTIPVELDAYQERVAERQQAEARTLAKLTGWDLQDMLSRVDIIDIEPDASRWWERLWKD